MATSSSSGHEHLPDSKSPHRRSNYCWLFNQFSLDIQHQISIRLLVRASQLLPWCYNRNRHWPLPIITNIHKLNINQANHKYKRNKTINQINSMESYTSHYTVVNDEEIDYTIEWAVYTEKEVHEAGSCYVTEYIPMADPVRFYSETEDYCWNDYLDTPFTKAVMEDWVEGFIKN